MTTLTKTIKKKKKTTTTNNTKTKTKSYIGGFLLGISAIICIPGGLNGLPYADFCLIITGILLICYHNPVPGAGWAGGVN